MANHDNNDDRFDGLLRHVVHTAPMPQPPAEFAREMSKRVQDHAEEAGFEGWLVRVVLAIAAIAAGVVAIPFATLAGTRITTLLEGAPWPLLLAAGFVFAAMKLAELARPSMKPSHGARS